MFCVFRDLVDSVKNGLQNFGLKFISVDDKLVYALLNARLSEIRPIVISVISRPVLDGFITKLKAGKSYDHHGRIHNGVLKGVPVSVIHGDMGAPNAAVQMELLKRAHVRMVIRADICGSISDSVEIGSIVIAKAALVGDGTSAYYFRKYKPNTHPPESIDAHAGLLKTMTEQTDRLQEQLQINMHATTVWSTDALFCEDTQEISRWQAKGATAVDMETSVMYLLGELFRIPVISLMGTVDHPCTEYDFIRTNNLHTDTAKAIKTVVEVVEKIMKNINSFDSQSI